MPGKAALAPPLPVTILRGHSSGVQALCYLNDDVVLSGSQDGLVKVWDLERRRARVEFEATSQGMGVQRLDLLGSSKVVSQGRDMFIKVWDAERLAGGGNERSGTKFSPEPLRQLPAGAFHFCQFALTRWREDSGSAAEGTASTIPTSVGSVRGIHVDGDAGTRKEENGGARPRRREEDEREKLGEGREDESADTSLQKPTVTPTVGGYNEEPCPSSRSSSSSFMEHAMLAPCGEQHTMSLWDLRKNRPALSFAPKDADRKGMVMCARLLGESACSASPFAVVGHDSGHLCVYDVRATSVQPLVESRLHQAPLLCVDVGSCCQQGVSGSADDSINVFRLSTRKASCEVVKTFHLEHPGTSCVEIRRDQKLFVSGGWDHRVRVFSWKKPRPLAVLRSHEKNVYTVAFSPRLGGLVSGSGDSRVALWELFPGKKGWGSRRLHRET